MLNRIYVLNEHQRVLAVYLFVAIQDSIKHKPIYLHAYRWNIFPAVNFS